MLLAALGVTIVRIGQMLDAHMFIGMLLLGPVALKMGSTGYRFVRYYAGNAAYRIKGPPPIELRLLAPFVVVLTVAVFGTGVALLLVGPEHRGILGRCTRSASSSGSPSPPCTCWATSSSCRARSRARHAATPPGTTRAPAAARARCCSPSAIAGGLMLAFVAESQFGVWANYHHHHG